MKKFLIFAIALMMVLSLVACGENKSGNNDISNTQQTSTNDNGKTENPDQSKKDDNKENTSVTSGNFHMVATGLNLYKIGNDFMNGTADFWRYLGNDQYEIYYWDNGEFVASGVTCGISSIMEFTEEDLKDCTKTSDTKEICGVTCVKYIDKAGTEYYYDESLKLIFEVWYKGASGAAFTVTKWETNVTEFLVPAPQK